MKWKWEKAHRKDTDQSNIFTQLVWEMFLFIQGALTHKEENKKCNIKGG